MLICIPASGLGKRCDEVSGGKPKYLIEIEPGKAMISYVLDFLKPLNFLDAKYIFLIQREVYNQHKEETDSIFNFYLSKNHYEIILVDGQTEGAACTVMLARKYLSLFAEEELIITNSDQFIDNFDALDFVKKARWSSVGSLLTFPNDFNPKWSFSKIKESFPFDVEKVVEKEVLPGKWESNVGFYYWKKASDFINACENMISLKQKVNGEYYISPLYNYLIDCGRRITTYLIPAENMIGMGTSEDILAARQFFLDKKEKRDNLLV